MLIRVVPMVLAVVVCCDCASIYRSYKHKIERLQTEAVIRVRENRIREALDCYRQILAIDPENDKARDGIEKIRADQQIRIEKLYNRGLSYERRKRPIRALNEYNYLLSLNEGRPYQDVQKRIGGLRKEPKVQAEFQRLKKQGIEHYWKNRLVDARENIEDALAIINDDRECRDFLDKIRDEIIDLAEKNYELGLTFLKNGNFEKAHQYFQKTLELNWDHKGAMAQVLAHRRRLHNQGIVLAASQRARRGDCMGAVQRLNKIVGRDEPAIRLRQRCLEEIRGRAESLYQRAVGLYNAQKLAESVRLLRWVLLVKPQHRQARRYYNIAQKKLQTLGELK